MASTVEIISVSGVMLAEPRNFEAGIFHPYGTP
jgi:hypothetical protein